ncbi:MAG: hypothetical protein MJZ37_00330 [Bacilli bacterium]|nr:hypothetical protein [Bacilli bacterium]
MNKVVIKSLIGQNGESLGAYVDYGDFCKMQREYEEQIEKMKPYCKELCKNYIKTEFMGNDCYNGVCRNCDKWELKNE